MPYGINTQNKYLFTFSFRTQNPAVFLSNLLCCPIFTFNTFLSPLLLHLPFRPNSQSCNLKQLPCLFRLQQWKTVFQFLYCCIWQNHKMTIPNQQEFCFSHSTSGFHFASKKKPRVVMPAIPTLATHICHVLPGISHVSRLDCWECKSTSENIKRLINSAHIDWAIKTVPEFPATKFCGNACSDSSAGQCGKRSLKTESLKSIALTILKFTKAFQESPLCLAAPQFMGNISSPLLAIWCGTQQELNIRMEEDSSSMLISKYGVYTKWTRRLSAFIRKSNGATLATHISSLQKKMNLNHTLTPSRNTVGIICGIHTHSALIFHYRGHIT